MAMNFPATTDADKAYAMKAAEFRSLPNDAQGMAMLRQATNGPFGSLALIEIDKRTRAELMNAVQQQNANQQDQTMLQQALQRQAQAQMMGKLANDERMGLNNIVAQAEQGALQFGEPAPEGMAGGGVVAFQGGGRTDPYRTYTGMADPTSNIFQFTPEEAEEQKGLKDASFADAIKFLRSKLTGTSTATPIDRDVLEYPDESKRGTASYLKEPGSKAPNLRTQSEADSAITVPKDKTGIAALMAPQIEKDPRKILEAESALLKEMGLGEYGGKVKESIEKRRGETKERAEKRLGSETFLAAAEAAGGGGKRMSGLQALAAAVGGAGKTAAAIGRERDTAMDKITEGEEKLLLAQDLYERGRVSDATKVGRAAEQQIFDNQTKLKALDLTGRKIDAAIAAAKARAGAGGAFKQDIAKLSVEIQNIMNAMATTKDPRQIAQLQQQLQILRAAQARALMSGGSGISITDEED